MRLTYSGGFSLQEKWEAREIIFSNILNAFVITFPKMEKMKLRYGSKATFVCIWIHRWIEVLSAMKAIYADAGFQKAVEKGNEYAMHDNFQ